MVVVLVGIDIAIDRENGRTGIGVEAGVGTDIESPIDIDEAEIGVSTTVRLAVEAEVLAGTMGMLHDRRVKRIRKPPRL